ncbi:MULTISPECIES: twin-arginine translocase TatA/TatE family subunit [unclassified Aureimonas]|uniref:twin-arginine translocase TatA/TatE family subunit n=1 Tax=unclassified Aureimonas TaxID=2615206 RepID=UPI0006F4E5DF|nr:MULTISPECIES: twin-arginine translocase TatA/TatE family subunit [unclassified Aureimonas]KQT60527.1 prohead protease [Aureimonas sp. Leaf427]KQT79404.1 prohead protease [Aureimonas sp. Leaf460]
MGSFSIWHWLIVLAVVLLLFGRGKIPELMGDVAKGIKNFKKGMSDDETTVVQERRSLDHRDGDIVSHDPNKVEKTIV